MRCPPPVPLPRLHLAPTLVASSAAVISFAPVVLAAQLYHTTPAALPCIHGPLPSPVAAPPAGSLLLQSLRPSSCPLPLDPPLHCYLIANLAMRPAARLRSGNGSVPCGFGELGVSVALRRCGPALPAVTRQTSRAKSNQVIVTATRRVTNSGSGNYRPVILPLPFPSREKILQPPAYTLAHLACHMSLLLLTEGAGTREVEQQVQQSKILGC